MLYELFLTEALRRRSTVALSIPYTLCEVLNESSL